MDALRLTQQDFRARIRPHRAWAWLALDVGRLRLALTLSAMPAVALLAAIAWGPPGLGHAATDPVNVHNTFARFLSAVATASTIAISVATLTFRHEMKGLRDQRDRDEEKDEYRARVRSAGPRSTMPVSLAAALASALDALDASASEARQKASERERGHVVEGVRLDALLQSLSERAGRAAHNVLDASQRPDRLALAAADPETELTEALLRRFAREEDLEEQTREALEEVRERLRDYGALARYAKDLDLRWGLSRMSTSILLTSLPALSICAAMLLTYGPGATALWGTLGAGALVAAAIFAAFVPLATFVSYTLRFVFFNEFTLPSGSFVLGPEEPGLVDMERRRHPRSPSRG